MSDLSTELGQELKNGKELSTQLVEHLIAMGSACCKIPVEADGRKFFVEVSPESGVGMYGETPRIEIGKYSICRQDEKSIWLEIDGEEGFQLDDKTAELCMKDVFEKYL